jgi:hypothetical protein
VNVKVKIRPVLRPRLFTSRFASCFSVIGKLFPEIERRFNTHDSYISGST